jgi:hypothetical protein
MNNGRKMFYSGGRDSVDIVAKTAPTEEVLVPGFRISIFFFSIFFALRQQQHI